MLSFLTTIPVPLKTGIPEEDFGKGLSFAVPIGLIVGGMLAASDYILAMFLPRPVCAVLILVIYIRITGGLHLDGLGDTFDGVFSNRPREKILEIMKDSRVGSNAVIALICLLLLNTALLYEAQWHRTAMLVLMPAAGRMGMLLSAGISKYARSEGGLGKSFMEFCGWKQVLAGFIFFAAALAVFFNIGIALAGIASSVFAAAAARFFGKKLDGVTGDILGAICEMTQTCFMLAFIILAGVF